MSNNIDRLYFLYHSKYRKITVKSFSYSYEVKITYKDTAKDLKSEIAHFGEVSEAQQFALWKASCTEIHINPTFIIREKLGKILIKYVN